MKRTCAASPGGRRALAPIPLSQVTSEATLNLDYEVGGEAPESPIQVSYQVFRKGGRMELPVTAEYPADTESISLMIFDLEKKQEQ